VAQRAAERDWPTKVEVGLIGSCTNSSYEDMARVANICQQAIDKGYEAKAGFLISPGSEQIRATIARDGFSGIFEQVGGVCKDCDPNGRPMDFTDYARHLALDHDNIINVVSPEVRNHLSLTFPGSDAIITR